MFEILPKTEEKNILSVKVSGKLTDADYKQFLPILEQMIRDVGRLSLYVDMQDFEGWETKAVWDDFRFGLQHDDDFKRIAIIAEKPLIHAAIGFSNIFSHIEMRYFDSAESEVARDWLREKSYGSDLSELVQPYKNILLPTDFSLYSDIAAKRSLQLAEQYGAKLHVLHTVEDYSFYNEGYDPIIAEPPLQDDSLIEQAQGQMQKYCERNALGKDVDVKTQWGNPKRSIIACVQEKNIDLIVMGSHGRHGVERLLGSVSNAVLHKAACDVFIVKQ